MLDSPLRPEASLHCLLLGLDSCQWLFIGWIKVLGVQEPPVNISILPAQVFIASQLGVAFYSPEVSPQEQGEGV